MIFADDLILETAYGLDILFEAAERGNNDFDIQSCRYKYNGAIESDLKLRFIDGDKNSPIVPIAGLMRRKALEITGKIDKRFIAVSYDIDLAMRFHKLGGTVQLHDVFVNEVRELRGGSRLFNENWKPDRQLVNDLWITEGKFREARKDSLVEFSDLRILLFSQGPRGHWPGGKSKIIEFCLNTPWRVKRYRMLLRELLR